MRQGVDWRLLCKPRLTGCPAQNAASGDMRARPPLPIQCTRPLEVPVTVHESRSARIRRELGALFSLALPIMVAQLSYSAMGFVDTLMSGRVSPRDLAAVALGNSIWGPGGLAVA